MLTTIQSVADAVAENATTWAGNAERYVAEDLDGGTDARTVMYAHAAAIQTDVEHLLSGHEFKASSVVFGILPLGHSNACVLKHDMQGRELDQPLIVVNWGLVLALRSLFTAFAIYLSGESLSDNWRALSRQEFINAVRRYESPTAQTMAETEFTPPDDWTLGIADELGVWAGSFQSVVLWFIALHEVGHIVNGDTDGANSVARLSAVGSEVELSYARPQTEALANWPCELAADRFALTWLCDWGSDRPSRWSNTAQVVVFFRWLMTVEHRRGSPLSPYHPPANQRLAELIASATILAGSPMPPEDQHVIDSAFQLWTEASL